MLLVNIMHDDRHLIEYLVVSQFFKLFGIQTFDSYTSSKNFKQLKSKDMSFEIIDVVNIVVLPNDRYKYGRVGEGKNIYVSSNILECPEGSIIEFPKHYNRDELQVFFEKLLMDIEVRTPELKLNYIKRKNMIEMFLTCNILKNYYIPTRVIPLAEYAKKAVREMDNNVCRYNMYLDNFSDFKSIYTIYGVLNLADMTNNVCKKVGCNCVIPWEVILKECDRYGIVGNTRFDFLIGQIYDDSYKNNMFASSYYSTAFDDMDFSYYLYYRLAKLYEFRFNEIKSAEELYRLSFSINPEYYRSGYKYGVCRNKLNDYNGSLNVFSDVYNVLNRRIRKDYWQVYDGEYFIKVCSELLSLNRYFQDKEGETLYKEKAFEVIEKVTSNKFLDDLGSFLNMKKGEIDRIKENVQNYLYLIYAKYFEKK